MSISLLPIQTIPYNGNALTLPFHKKIYVKCAKGFKTNSDIKSGGWKKSRPTQFQKTGPQGRRPKNSRRNDFLCVLITTLRR